MSSNDFGPPPPADNATFLRYPLGTGSIVNLSVSYYFKSFKTFLSHLIPFLIIVGLYFFINQALLAIYPTSSVDIANLTDPNAISNYTSNQLISAFVNEIGLLLISEVLKNSL